MSNYWSEEELKALGYIEDAKGNWARPDSPRKRSGTGFGIGNPCEVSKHKPNLQRQAKRSDAAKKRNEASGKRRNSGIRYIATVISYEVKCGVGADTDNVCPKWFIDEIIRSGLLPVDLTDDNFEQICLTQKAIKRVKTRKEQRTLIRIHRVN